MSFCLLQRRQRRQARGERARDVRRSKGWKRERRQQGRKAEIKTRRGEFRAEDFLWWDRGIIWLGNFELHYEEPCTVSARGQLHEHDTTACANITNVNRGAAEQVYCPFLLLQTVWLMCSLIFFSHSHRDPGPFSMGIIKEMYIHLKNTPPRCIRGVTTGWF